MSIYIWLILAETVLKKQRMSVLEKGETCLPVKMYCKIMILKPKFWEGMFKREGAYG